MIAPEYFNNNIAVEGYIIVKNVPNEQGTLLVWNPSTKKLATRTNSELISDLSLMTTNTSQHIDAIKFFDTFPGGNWNKNSLGIYSVAPTNPAITFYKEGESVGQIQYNLFNFNFINSDGSGYSSVTASAFKKAGGNGNYLLKDDGSTILLSDFATASDLSFYHKRDSTVLLNNASDTHTNQTWFDYNWADTGRLGSVINFSGFFGGYSTELFGSYNQPDLIAIRTKQGDFSFWNEPRWLWHDKNFNPDSKVNKSGDTMTGALTIKSGGAVGVFKGYDNNTNYLIWRNYPDTKDIGYIGADGNSAVGGGIGDGFGIVAAAGDLQLVSSANVKLRSAGAIIMEANVVVPNATLGNHAVNLNQLIQSLGGYFPIRPIVAGTDANHEITSGLRTDYIWSNTPVSTIGTLLVESYSNDWIAQTFTVLGTGVAGQVWKRIRHSGTTWTNWVIQATQTWTNEQLQNVVKLNQQFSVNGSQVALTDDYVDSEVGLTDIGDDILIAGKRGNLYQFGTPVGASFGMGIYMNPNNGNIGYSTVPSSDISHKHYFNGTVATNSGFAILGGTENQIYTGDGGIVEMDWEVINESGKLRYKPYSRRFTGTYNTFGTDNRDVRVIMIDGGEIIMEERYENQKISIINLSGYATIFQIDNTSVNVTIPPRSSAEYLVDEAMNVIQVSLNINNTVIVS